MPNSAERRKRAPAAPALARAGRLPKEPFGELAGDWDAVAEQAASDSEVGGRI